MVRPPIGSFRAIIHSGYKPSRKFGGRHAVLGNVFHLYSIGAPVYFTITMLRLIGFLRADTPFIATGALPANPDHTHSEPGDTRGGANKSLPICVSSHRLISIDRQGQGAALI